MVREEIACRLIPGFPIQIFEIFGIWIWGEVFFTKVSFKVGFQTIKILDTEKVNWMILSLRCEGN